MHSFEAKALTGKHIHAGFTVVSEHRIYLEWDDRFQNVRFRIEEGTDGSFHIRQSHYIKTPLQARPYIKGQTFASVSESALYQAVTSITDYYDKAVSEGHVPNNDWFVVNEDF
jgi:hypothetical protein